MPYANGEATVIALLAAQIRLDLIRRGISLAEGRDAWAIAPDEYWEIQARALHQRTPNAVERAEILEAL